MNYGLDHVGIMNELAKQSSFDVVILGGDNIQGQQIKASTINDLDNLMGVVMGHDYPTLVVRGNHDTNAFKTGPYDDVPPDINDCINAQDWYTHVVSVIAKDITVDPSNSSSAYYYKDFEEQKIRIIVLDMVDVPEIKEDNGKARYISGYPSGYGIQNTQLNWLANVALNFDLKEDNKVEWQVLLVSHMSPESTIIGDGGYNFDVLRGVIQAFKNGCNYTSGTWVDPPGQVSNPNAPIDFARNVSVNFEYRGVVIAWISGHIHCDSVFNINGIQYITTNNSVPSEDGRNGMHCFDAYVIDRMCNTINVERYGYGASRRFVYNLS